MGEKNRWIVSDDGMNYVVKVEINKFTGNHKVFINSREKRVKLNWKEKIVGATRGYMLDRKTITVVFRGNKVDVVDDGYYLTSKKPYEPLEKLPRWVWYFVVACMAIPVFTVGGAIPAVIGVSGAMICMKVSVMPKTNEMGRALIALVVTIGCWVLLIIFLGLLVQLS